MGNENTIARPAARTTRAASAPVERIVERYLREAVALEASDLHIEPSRDDRVPSPDSLHTEPQLRVRARVDGRLRDLAPPPTALGDAIVGRLRLMAGADLSERRLPQDGRFTLENSAGDVDIRASFLPVHEGERVVLRMIRRRGRSQRVDELGLTKAQERQLVEIAGQSDGLILVAGPTGSGKTTTLYALLEHLRRPDLCLITVEDPVERAIAGVAQIAVDARAGRGFDTALRAVLRQDPDLVMIGEIRDNVSAQIACRAALTGHRVLTTVHATDCREAQVRLDDLGIERSLVRSTLRLIVAQRLVRVVCRTCATMRPPSHDERQLFADLRIPVPPSVADIRGCRACGQTGYRQRRAIFDLFDPRGDPSPPSEGLVRSGLRAVAAGVTTADEVLSVCPKC